MSFWDDVKEKFDNTVNKTIHERLDNLETTIKALGEEVYGDAKTVATTEEPTVAGQLGATVTDVAADVTGQHSASSSTDVNAVAAESPAVPPVTNS